MQENGGGPFYLTNPVIDRLLWISIQVEKTISNRHQIEISNPSKTLFLVLYFTVSTFLSVPNFYSAPSGIFIT